MGTGNLAAVIPADAYTTGFPFFQESLLGISEVAGMLKYHVMLVTGVANDISGLAELVEEKRLTGPSCCAAWRETGCFSIWRSAVSRRH